MDHSEYQMGLPSSQQLHGCVTNRHVIITLLNGSSLLREKATHVEQQTTAEIIWFAKWIDMLNKEVYCLVISKCEGGKMVQWSLVSFALIK